MCDMCTSCTVMTTARGGAKSWNKGGGVYPNIRYWTLPRTPQKPFFSQSQRRRNNTCYKYCIFKIHHKCTMSQQCLSSLIMFDCHMIYSGGTIFMEKTLSSRRALGQTQKQNPSVGLTKTGVNFHTTFPKNFI